MTKVEMINCQDAYELINSGKAKLIDIRAADEYARENIASSDNIGVDQLSARNFSDHDTLIFHCQSGVRTKNAIPLLQRLENKKLLILEGGLTAWKKQGLPVNSNKKAPLPIMRQVQIIVGFMVIVGVVLGLTLSPWFALISAFFGAGLLFAGISGFCGLASLLMLLPYNRR
ncbi:MAG: rhodanese family protein [Francisellaceae bacterium]